VVHNTGTNDIAAHFSALTSFIKSVPAIGVYPLGHAQDVFDWDPQVVVE
jgi:hypothetical protein